MSDTKSPPPAGGGLPGESPQPYYPQAGPGQPPQPPYGQPGQPMQPGYGQPGQPMQPGYGQPGQQMQPASGGAQRVLPADIRGTAVSYVRSNSYSYVHEQKLKGETFCQYLFVLFQMTSQISVKKLLKYRWVHVFVVFSCMAYLF